MLRCPKVRSTLVVAAILLAGCSSDAETSAPATTAGTTTAATTTTAAPTTTATPATTTDAPTTTAPAPERPYSFAVAELPLIDTIRTTVRLDGEVVPRRDLPTTLYLPDTGAPVPLIVFSHGFGASPAKFERLLGAWAAAGYGVAAPAFPLTSDLIPFEQRVVGDVANQAADVAFVLDQVLASEYAARFDPDRVAAAGLSLGGLTTYIAAVDEATRDPRFTAAIVMAAVPPGAPFEAHPMPILIMHGELDPVVPAATADAVFAALEAPAYEVTMLGGFHAEPFEDEEENPVFPDRERFHPIVDATSIAFWDTHLLADPTAEPGIAEAGDQAGITTFASR